MLPLSRTQTPMKTVKTYLWGLLALSMLILGSSNPSFAAPPIPAPFVPNYVYQGSGPATAGTTFATTSYADLTGATVSFVPTNNDPTTAGRSALATPTADLIEVTWNLDVVKATATTGTCALYANGAVIAASARTVDFAAKNTTISETWVVANTTVGTQTIKLQCKSGDTNVFTVNFGMIAVKEWVY